MAKSPPRVLILGATGMLGSEILGGKAFSRWEIVAHGRTSESGLGVSADLTDYKQAYSLLESWSPRTIVNLVALTDVDRCEEHPDEAYLANVKTLENVVRWIKTTGCGTHLIHLSSDQIYDGQGPHSEEFVCPRNYYAFSKYAGELIARSVDSAILRTNFFGMSRCAARSSFTDWLHFHLTQGNEIQVFDDIMFSPLSMGRLAVVLEHVASRRLHGVFNVGSREGMSKADFAYAFAEELGLDSRFMTRMTSGDGRSLRAYRPKDMRLTVTKFEEVSGYQLPTTLSEIKKVCEGYR